MHLKLKTQELELRTVALFEAAKGILVLLAGFGVLSLIHRDVQQTAEEVIRRMHMNPASHYPHIFLEAIGRVNDSNLWLLAVGALAYSVIRLSEAYGLWHNRNWAKWLGIVSAVLYLPLEFYELWLSITVIKTIALVANLLIIGLLVLTLRQNGYPNPQTAAGDVG